MSDLPPELFRYTNFRQYLIDFFDFCRQKKPSFSLESFCRKTGDFSKSHLSLILNNKRNLTPEKTKTLAQGLQLSESEAKYFHYLVLYNQAKDFSEKERFLSAMINMVPLPNKEYFKTDQYRILECWHGLVIRELARMPGFQCDPQWIVHWLKNRLSCAEAQRAVDLLLSLGLLQKDAEGVFRPSDATIYTTDELSSLAIREYHKSCLDLAKVAIDNDPVERREFASVTVMVAPEIHAIIKQKIKDFRDEVIQLQEQVSQSNAKVCQVNIQFLELSI